MGQNLRTNKGKCTKVKKVCQKLRKCEKVRDGAKVDKVQNLRKYVKSQEKCDNSWESVAKVKKIEKGCRFTKMLF